MENKNKTLTKEEADELLRKLSDIIRNNPVPKPIGWSHMSSGTAWGMDVERFEYQQPERDEQGTYYGYKILYRQSTECDCPECTSLMSPRYPSRWMHGELTSDQEPTDSPGDLHGIHFCKRMDNSELEGYTRPFGGAIHRYEGAVLVRCALSGTIVETERGFRAQHAQIIGVYWNGHWQNYSNYQEHTSTHPRPNPYEKSWDEDRY